MKDTFNVSEVSFMLSLVETSCQWRIQGGSLGSVEPPLLSFCAHASPALCARTRAVENVLDNGTPFSKS